MSDHFEYWFFPKLEKHEVAEAKLKRLNNFWSRGLLNKTNDPDSVLGGTEAYRPTAKLASLYNAKNNHFSMSLDLETCGMEVCEGFGFKGWELNEIERLACPNCRRESDLETIALYDAIDEFHQSGIIPSMHCPRCGTAPSAKDWKSEPRLTFTYLGFAFWNWPPLKSESDGKWSLDLPDMMHELVQSPIAYSYGRL